MNEPSVTIVIPVYNRENLIADTIESALAQNYKNLKIIIVDNQSDDMTWSIVQEYERHHDAISAYQNKTNIGPVENWHRAISLAQSDYIKIIFSDDLLMPDVIAEFVKLMDKDVGFVSSSPLVGQSLKSAKKRYVFSRLKDVNIINTHHYLTTTLLMFGGLVSPSAALFRRSDLLSAFTRKIANNPGPAFEYYGAGPDLLLFLLTAQKYENVAWINKPLVFFRDHPDSATVKAHSEKVFDIKQSYILTRIWFAQQYGFDNIARILMARYHRMTHALEPSGNGNKHLGSMRHLLVNLHYLIVSIWLNK